MYFFLVWLLSANIVSVRFFYGSSLLLLSYEYMYFDGLGLYLLGSIMSKAAGSIFVLVFPCICINFSFIGCLDNTEWSSPWILYIPPLMCFKIFSSMISFSFEYKYLTHTSLDLYLGVSCFWMKFWTCF
jgi:hypothetical protein